MIFPRHDELLARIDARLAAGSARTSLLAVSEAASLVLEQYLQEGELARSRYRLTRSVPALRDREVASMLGYQRLFREYVRGWLGECGGPDTDLHAELLAAAVVTAHNVVLRRWLRGEAEEPRREFAEAMQTVFTMTRAWAGEPSEVDVGSTVVVLRSDRSLEDVLPDLRDALGGHERK